MKFNVSLIKLILKSNFLFYNCLLSSLSNILYPYELLFLYHRNHIRLCPHLELYWRTSFENEPKQPLSQTGHWWFHKKVDMPKTQRISKIYGKSFFKFQLAIKMTNCLNTQMGKALIAECEELKDCKIQGDDW